MPRLDQFDDDLITIPKYPGKTNEQFTKLLLNLTVLASTSAEQMLTRRLRVLDPLCGRGTTLNQALTYGYDAAGVDLDGKDFDAYATYIPTYLKRKRIKHQAHVGPVRRERRHVARRLTVTLAATKESYRAGDTLNLDVVHADTTAADQFFKPASFDVIVADAPYGIQHGSRTVAAGLRRSPVELLAAAVPGWVPLLRPGGAFGLSWNTLVAPRADAEAILTKAGLSVLEYPSFRHRVDQSIVRDILIARR
jgi:tRNA G10  N-methylase Trm11